jgi:hypothetical protein
MASAAEKPEASPDSNDVLYPVTEQADPELDGLVREIIGRIADKWTMLVLETLTEHGRLRFTRLGELIGGVSQKMLTPYGPETEGCCLVSSRNVCNVDVTRYFSLS